MFFIYQILTCLILLVSPIIILFRIIKKKESKSRFIEKFTIFSKQRKNQKLKQRVQKKCNMATQLGEDTKVTLDLKTIGIIIGFTISLATTYFTLKSDIALAKELPEPVISRTEYDLKDELVRQTIMDTQQDVDQILEELEKIDERLYEIRKNQ